MNAITGMREVVWPSGACNLESCSDHKPTLFPRSTLFMSQRTKESLEMRLTTSWHCILLLATLVNSQLVSLLPVGTLNLLCSICNISPGTVMPNNNPFACHSIYTVRETGCWMFGPKSSLQTDKKILHVHVHTILTRQAALLA